jgi:hypothetical protein
VFSSIWNSELWMKSGNPVIVLDTVARILQILDPRSVPPPSTFAVTEHSFEPTHRVLFHETEVLTRMSGCMVRSIEEEREVKLHSS